MHEYAISWAHNVLITLQGVVLKVTQCISSRDWQTVLCQVWISCCMQFLTWYTSHCTYCILMCTWLYLLCVYRDVSMVIGDTSISSSHTQCHSTAGTVYSESLLQFSNLLQSGCWSPWWGSRDGSRLPGWMAWRRWNYSSLHTAGCPCGWPHCMWNVKDKWHCIVTRAQYLAATGTIQYVYMWWSLKASTNSHV